MANPATISASNDNRNIAWQHLFSDRGDFAAFVSASAFAKRAGFCVGSTCAGHPTGLMHGYDYVAKWRNLSIAERAALHGVMFGDIRHGPIMVVIFDLAPFEARVALSGNTGTSA